MSPGPQREVTMSCLDSPLSCKNEQGCMHLSRPRSSLRRWRSCSSLFPPRLASLLPPHNHYEPGSDTQSSQKTEALVQTQTTNYKLPLSSLLKLWLPPLFLSHGSFSCLSTHTDSQCNINLAVRGAFVMWQTCHCNRQHDKCRGWRSSVDSSLSPTGMWLGWGRWAHGDFLKDNEPLNDG